MDDARAAPEGSGRVARKEERNKHIAIAFYDLMFNESKPREAVDQFVGDPYRQHDPSERTAKRRSSSTSSGWRATSPESTWSSNVPSRMGTM